MADCRRCRWFKTHNLTSEERRAVERTARARGEAPLGYCRLYGRGVQRPYNRSYNITAWLIRQRLKYTRRQCFTYAGLRNTYNYYKRKQEIALDWHTVEREIRRMAEAGLLKRVILRKNGRQKVVFCTNGDI